MSGHLLRCRCACFAKREEWIIASETDPRETLSGPPVRLQYAAGRFSRRLASDTLLNRLSALE